MKNSTPKLCFAPKVSISQLQEPVRNLEFSLQGLRGVGPTTEHIIQEILRTGTSSYYEKLLIG